jgi:hypothetical protein
MHEGASFHRRHGLDWRTDCTREIVRQRDNAASKKQGGLVMQGRQRSMPGYGIEGERRILGEIVDAMLVSVEELRLATREDWQRILTISCRLRKRNARGTLVVGC